MTDLETIIRKHVLKNAHDFGKANPGAVVGKVIAEYPEAKKDMKKTMKMINGTVASINKIKSEEIEKEMGKYEYVKKEEKEKELEVPGAKKGKVVTRFPPEPSGYPHIGHAKAAFLDYEVAKRYDGKMILRFDDTNPEKESQEYVDAIKEGLKWLGIEWEQETYTSNRIPEIYAVAEKLISKEKAYVCTCSTEEISEGRTKSKPCKCREMGKDDHLERWKDMLKGKFEPGKVVLRFKGNLESLNTVMRDPALARVIKTSHFRQGDEYMVWPSYDLAVAFMDHAEGITHPMRSKEYELRDELYYALFDAMGWRKPHMIEFSRLSIKNAPISKRLLTPLVTGNKVMGWDDPRLPTLSGLSRRGILPEAIKNFVLSFGISKVESEPDWEALLTENRKLIDPIADRYYFVPDPIKLIVTGGPEETVRLKKHPKLDHGFREIKVKDTFYISGGDSENIEKDEIFRLKDLYDVEILEKGEVLEGKYAGNEKVSKKVQWVSDDKIDCEVLVPKDLLKDGEYNPESLEVVKGVCESNCAKLDEGTTIQFERFGFVRLDKKGKNKLVFVYSC